MAEYRDYSIHIPFNSKTIGSTSDTASKKCRSEQPRQEFEQKGCLYAMIASESQALCFML